jgi:hypothetical protein
MPAGITIRINTTDGRRSGASACAKARAPRPCARCGLCAGHAVTRQRGARRRRRTACAGAAQGLGLNFHVCGDARRAAPRTPAVARAHARRSLLPCAQGSRAASPFAGAAAARHGAAGFPIGWGSLAAAEKKGPPPRNRVPRAAPPHVAAAARSSARGRTLAGGSDWRQRRRREAAERAARSRRSQFSARLGPASHGSPLLPPPQAPNARAGHAARAEQGCCHPAAAELERGSARRGRCGGSCPQKPQSWEPKRLRPPAATAAAGRGRTDARAHAAPRKVRRRALACAPLEARVGRAKDGGGEEEGRMAGGFFHYNSARAIRESVHPATWGGTGAVPPVIAVLFLAAGAQRRALCAAL